MDVGFRRRRPSDCFQGPVTFLTRSPGPDVGKSGSRAVHAVHGPTCPPQRGTTPCGIRSRTSSRRPDPSPRSGSPSLRAAGSTGLSSPRPPASARAGWPALRYLRINGLSCRFGFGIPGPSCAAEVRCSGAGRSGRRSRRGRPGVRGRRAVAVHEARDAVAVAEHLGGQGAGDDVDVGKAAQLALQHVVGAQRCCRTRSA